MAKSVFADKPLPSENVKFNQYDLSHNVHGSYKFGYAYPVFCREVLSRQKVEITPNFGFQLEPLAFPVQTTLRARLHFFYVRNRTLWKDYMDFYGGTKENLSMPYVKAVAGSDRSKQFIKTGGLFDHLGIPTTLNRSLLGTYTMRSLICVDNAIRTADGPITSHIDESPLYLTSTPSSQLVTFNPALKTLNLTPSPLVPIPSSSNNFIGWMSSSSPMARMHRDNSNTSFVLIPQQLYTPTDAQSIQLRICLVRSAGINDGTSKDHFTVLQTFNWQFTYTSSGGRLTHPLTQTDVDTWNSVLDQHSSQRPIYVVVCCATNATNREHYISQTNVLSTDDGFAMPFSALSYPSMYDSTSQVDDTQCPFVVQQGQTTPKIPINALSLRAYRAICNAYYRNINNDPLMINGTPEYNKFIETDEGGPDSTTPLELFRVNYELDAYTSALQSPQQGLAPLVGVTINPPMDRATLQFADKDEQYHDVTVALGEDGRISAIDSYSENTPSGTLSRLRENILSGIAINDLRAVSAMQRFLENNVARGYRYKEQVESHFGKAPSYNELLMPEFIGGCSRNFDINKITNVAETADAKLGQIAGNGVLMSGCDKITHTCDENGYIIGILSFTVIPVYQDILPKHFTKMHRLDYFYPEFSHLGFQGIKRTEMCPLLTNFVDSNKLNETFGYQRPWYEYQGDIDTAHGQMRTTYENYLCTRTFGTLPQLNADFLKVHPDDVNKIFTITSDDEDKIVGMISYHEIDTLPIPRFGRPQIV